MDHSKSLASHALPDEALVALVSVMDKEFTIGVKSTDFDHLLQVFKWVYASVEFKELKQIDCPSNTSVYEQLMCLSRYANCHVRQVFLEPNAWKKDQGSLIGFSKSTKEPCALIHQGTHYSIQFSDDNKKSKLTDEMAEDLMPFAYMVYPEFKEEAINLRYLFKFAIFPVRKELYFTVFLRFLISLLGLIVPVMTGFLFETVIPTSDYSLLFQLTLLLIFNSFIINIFTISQVIGLVRIRLKTNVRLQAALWLRLLKLPKTFFKKWEAGDLSLRVSAVDQIQQLITSALINTIINFFMAFLNLILIFYYSVEVGFLALFLMFILVFLIGGFSYFRIHYIQNSWTLRGIIASKILQIITNLSKIRLANVESYIFNRWAKDFSEKTRSDFLYGKLMNYFSIFTLSIASIATIAFFSLSFINKDSISFGDFIVLNSLLSMFFLSTISLVNMLGQLFNIVPLYQRAKPILTTIPEKTKLKGSRLEMVGTIELKNVSFRYPNQEFLILKDINFSIQSGQFIGIVGPSGSGKSTLLRLLVGLEKPTSGEIRFNNHDLFQFDLKYLRQQIGFLTQNTMLFPGSIYENIKGIMHDASEEAIHQAAQLACIAEEIMAMPMNYSTHILNHGENLSTGQRQRILLAQIFLRKPKILLLDEATSALDNEIQAKIQANLNQLNITRISVSHRASTLKEAHLVFSLSEGKLLLMQKGEKG